MCYYLKQTLFVYCDLDEDQMTFYDQRIEECYILFAPTVIQHTWLWDRGEAANSLIVKVSPNHNDSTLIPQL